MSKNKGYEELVVWQKAIDLVDCAYDLTTLFPKEEIYSLTSQIRRCAVSVPSNIAEGCARNSYGEFIQFLGIATGSLAELHTQLIIAVRRNYLSSEKFNTIKKHIDEIRKMINGLKTSLRSAQNTKLITRNS